MMLLILVSRGALAAGLVVLASPAAAQMYEAVGTRAQGMGGAFVAVADDANASWWNPAGLATGAYFSAVLERATWIEPAEVPASGPAWKVGAGGVSIAFPALGLSYYRLRISELRPIPPTATGDPSREDQGAAGVDLRSRAISEFGATVGQSLGNHVVVASRLTLVRAGQVVTGGAATGEEALDGVADFDLSREIHGDLDLGVMVTVARMRVGVSVKHLREPKFGDGADQFTLPRQARAGVAFLGGATSGGGSAITVAADADLTRTATPVGEVRHVATGVEAWLLGRRLGVRGGVSANTVGEVSTATSGGLSLGLQSGLFLDAAVTLGPDRSRQGWATAVRVTF